MEDLQWAVRNYNQLIRGVDKPVLRAFTTSLRDYLTNGVIISTACDYLVGVYRCFENRAGIVWTTDHPWPPLSWASYFEFSSRSWLLSDIETQIGGAYRSAASGWVVVTTLISVSLLLVHLRCQDFSGGTTASTSATHVLAFVDSPYTKEASHVETLPLAVAPVPEMCADECFEEDFWRSLQEG